jgi:hypothetical protein
MLVFPVSGAILTQPPRLLTTKFLTTFESWHWGFEFEWCNSDKKSWPCAFASLRHILYTLTKPRDFVKETVDWVFAAYTHLLRVPLAHLTIHIGSLPPSPTCCKPSWLISDPYALGCLQRSAEHQRQIKQPQRTSLPRIREVERPFRSWLPRKYHTAEHRPFTARVWLSEHKFQPM